MKLLIDKEFSLRSSLLTIEDVQSSSETSFMKFNRISKDTSFRLVLGKLTKPIPLEAYRDKTRLRKLGSFPTESKLASLVILGASITFPCKFRKVKLDELITKWKRSSPKKEVRKDVGSEKKKIEYWPEVSRNEGQIFKWCSDALEIL